MVIRRQWLSHNCNRVEWLDLTVLKSFEIILLFQSRLFAEKKYDRIIDFVGESVFCQNSFLNPGKRRRHPTPFISKFFCINCIHSPSRSVHILLLSISHLGKMSIPLTHTLSHSLARSHLPQSFLNKISSTAAKPLFETQNFQNGRIFLSTRVWKLHRF